MFKLLVSAVEGNQIHRARDVLRMASFRAERAPTQFDSWTTFAPHVHDATAKRVGVAMNRGWTIFLNEDVAIAIYGKSGVGERIARKLDTRVCVIYGNSVTATFGFELFSSSGLVRRFWIENDRKEEFGIPLPVEPSVAPEDFNEEHLLGIAKSLGVEVETTLEDCPPYFAYGQTPWWSPW